MLISKKNRREVYKFLFKEGVLYAEKDYNLEQHPEIEVPNLQVIKLMQSMKSKEFVSERYAWRHYYWFLTDKGIAYLREYLNLPAEILPATLKKTARPVGERPRPPMGDRPPRPEGGYRGGEGRGGYREGYRSGPREGGFGRGAPVDKAGAPGSYNPTFGGSGRGSA